MCKGMTLSGNKCRNKNMEGSEFCSRHQQQANGCAMCAKGTCKTHKYMSGCKSCGKTHKSTKEDVTCSRKNKQIAGVFCEKDAEGKSVCKFEVKEGKICGASTTSSDHPYCARHGTKGGDKGLIPVYDVSTGINCDFLGCSRIAISGTNLCSLHTGLCGYGLGTNMQCGLNVLTSTGMCAQGHLSNLTRCRCVGCNSVIFQDGLCVKHVAEGCKARWEFFRRNMANCTGKGCKKTKKVSKKVSMCDNCGVAIVV